MHLEAWSTHAAWSINGYSYFTCENDQKVFYKLMKDCLRFRIKQIFLFLTLTLLVQLDSFLQIEGEYHSASYDSKMLDTWMYTNSTFVELIFTYSRLGQQRSNEILVRWRFSENNDSTGFMSASV